MDAGARETGTVGNEEMVPHERSKDEWSRVHTYVQFLKILIWIRILFPILFAHLLNWIGFMYLNQPITRHRLTCYSIHSIVYLCHLALLRTTNCFDQGQLQDTV